MNPHECKHGRLARKCEICQYEQEIVELRAEVEKITAERDELFHKWSKTNGLTTRETAARCAEIAEAHEIRQDDGASNAIRKEFNL